MIESKREHKENFRIARLFLRFPFYLGPSWVLVHGNRQLAIKSAERSGFKKLTHLRRVLDRWFNVIFMEYGLRQQYS